MPTPKPPEFPLVINHPLGDGNWDKTYVDIFLNEDGTVKWDAEGYIERYKQDQRTFLGEDYTDQWKQ